jgi:hypothetical protein
LRHREQNLVAGGGYRRWRFNRHRRGLGRRGSNLRPCSGDIIPAAPIEALCSRIDASPTHACSYERLPDDGHLTCHASGYATCQRWFEALPRP